MANIITSKTRSQFKGSDVRKMDMERMTRIKQNHEVHEINTNAPLEVIEQELNRQGSKVRDGMQEKRGRNLEAHDEKSRERHRDNVQNMDALHRRKQREKEREKK